MSSVVSHITIHIDGSDIVVEKLEDGTFRKPAYLQEASREVIRAEDRRGEYDGHQRTSQAVNTNWRQFEERTDVRDNAIRTVTAPATPEAAQWEGWNTTMKPAVEYWILARKPLAESTIARQVLATGTGALNIDACRVEGASWGERPPRTLNALYGNGHGTDLTASNADSGGRWPANLVLSHSSECVQLDRVTPTEDRRKVSSGKGFCTTKYSGSAGEGEGTIIAGVCDYGDGKDAPAWQCTPDCPIAVLDAQGKDVGKYFTTLPYEAPFIYLPKASPKDKTMNGMVENGHETVKSTALMAWLCKLITPPNGTILDCFMGSGSTLVAAERLGFSWVGIDESPEYCAIARARLATLGVTICENDTQYQ